MLAEPPGQHENWVRLLASASDPVRGAYNVFELLEGRTLAQIIESSPLKPQEWRTFVDQSIAAAEMLHTLDWVHGDINADNFFQTSAGWKLLELPFLRPPPPPGRSAMFGSIFTLAPEQIDGAKPSVQTDIYALGCLYYYAASGKLSVYGSSTVEVALNIRDGGAPGLRERAPDLPPAWSDWVMKMISPQLKDRLPIARGGTSTAGRSCIKPSSCFTAHRMTPEFRRDPLHNTWVVFAPERQRRPQDFLPAVLQSAPISIPSPRATSA